MAKATVSKEEVDRDQNWDAVVYLLPEEVSEDPATNVRPWSSADDEQEEVEKLSRSIAEQGQINPITVRWKIHDGATMPEDGYYAIVTGRRRLAAIRLLNTKRAEASQGAPLRVAARYHAEMSDDDALREALSENSRRKDASPMDNAQNIASVRERFNWKSPKHTKDVADYFGMSPAWVTTHEKLLSLPESSKLMVNQRTLSMAGALALVKVKADDREKTLAAALKLRSDSEPVGAVGINTPIKARHVKQAVRNVAGAKQSRSRKEVLDFFSHLTAPELPKAVREFAEYLAKWASGEGTDRTLAEKFETAFHVHPSAATADKDRRPHAVITAAKGKQKIVKKAAKTPKKKASKKK